MFPASFSFIFLFLPIYLKTLWLWGKYILVGSTWPFEESQILIQKTFPIPNALTLSFRQMSAHVQSMAAWPDWKSAQNNIRTQLGPIQRK